MSAARALELTDEITGDTPPSKVRRALVKRLSDVICIPSSQLPPQERHMAGDVLVEPTLQYGRV